MESVAIYGRPVSSTGVEYLLENWAPYVDGPTVLNRLMVMHFIRREGKSYYLHPIDRDYSLGLLAGSERDRLRRRAADYYRQVQRPRSEWKTIEDIEPHLEQFRLRLEVGDAGTAASILEDVHAFLDKRGAFDQLLSLALSLKAATTDDDITRTALRNIASASWRLGRLSNAISAQEQLVEMLSHDGSSDDVFVARVNLLIYRMELGATEEGLETFREILAELEQRYPWATEQKVTTLHHIAECLGELGYLDAALCEQTRATELAQQWLDADSREAQIHNLGERYQALENTERAEQLFGEALVLAQESGNPLWKANHLSSLAGCSQRMGRIGEALQQIGDALQIRKQIGDLGGIARNTATEAEYLLAAGEVDRAAASAAKAYEQARDLKLPVRNYQRICAQTNMAQGEVAEAHRVLLERKEDHPGSRWDFDNLLGTVMLRLRKREEAREAFSRALAQSEVWLGRANENRNASAGKALALAGLVACGQNDALSRAKAAYRTALGARTEVGMIAEWRRRLELLAVDVGQKLIEPILWEMFEQGAATVDATVLKNERDQVFLSYAHEDSPWVEKLAVVLSPAIRNKRLDVWWDARIKAGQRWRKEIEGALERARVGVLLVSPAFLASDYVMEQELPFLLRAAEQRGVKLVWIHVVPSLVEETPLREIQCAHVYDRPLDSLAPHELSRCLVDIAREIKKAYEVA